MVELLHVLSSGFGSKCQVSCFVLHANYSEMNNFKALINNSSSL